MIKVKTYLVINKEATAVNIDKLMRINNTSPKELQEYLGFASVQSVYYWKYGKNIPSIDSLVLLSHIWGISINEILRCDIIEKYK